MAADRLRAILDNLGAAESKELERLRASGSAPAAVDNPLGLRFATGARVIDLVTGLRGVVHSGSRIASTNAELFRIQLVDASTQWRTPAQLEADPSPAPPAGASR